MAEESATPCSARSRERESMCDGGLSGNCVVEGGSLGEATAAVSGDGIGAVTVDSPNSNPRVQIEDMCDVNSSPQPPLAKSFTDFEVMATTTLEDYMVELGQNEPNVEDKVSELLNVKVKSDEEAYNLYNDYAFNIGFSIRKSKKRYRDRTPDLRGRELRCSKAGTKVVKGAQGKLYTKRDGRTGCKAMVYFNVDKNGEWIVTRHEMVHNHRFCPVEQRHLLRSQRKIDANQLAYFNQLLSSGIKVADAIRIMKKEAGGSPSLGFTAKNAYDEWGRQNKRKLDAGGISSTLELTSKNAYDEQGRQNKRKLDGGGVSPSLGLTSKDVYDERGRQNERKLDGGGCSQSLGLTSKDVYDERGRQNKRKLEGRDANTLISVLRSREKNEIDFFVDFKLGDDGALESLFWRDGKMKADYLLFGDLLVHDSTYRTNKYDMICGPFVVMNHHAKNIMVGCGLLLNETTESFVWLFKVFLESMDMKSPQTIMTDEAPSMTAAIRQVLPASRHRLCIWHLIENSKKHIELLMMQEDFVERFDLVLKHCETVNEFDEEWNRLVVDYECADNKWMKRLYDTKERWCPSYNKDFFSGGILSSQRSESTNSSLRIDLCSTTSLMDFYDVYNQVVHNWRSIENTDNFASSSGLPETTYQDVAILTQAARTYTMFMYYVFEDRYRRGHAYIHKVLSSEHDRITYKLWRPTKPHYEYLVTYKPDTCHVYCTCKSFEETGILCCHSLRVYDLSCVQHIPNQYISKRWTREVRPYVSDEADQQTLTNEGDLPPLAWSILWKRKYDYAISSSVNNKARRKIVEDFYTRLMGLLEEHPNDVHVSEESNRHHEDGSQASILNPTSN